jgi:hypothetical protein
MFLQKGDGFHHQVTKQDKVATLKNGELVYDYPIDVLDFPNYKGKMYHIANSSS